MLSKKLNLKNLLSRCKFQRLMLSKFQIRRFSRLQPPKKKRKNLSPKIRMVKKEKEALNSQMVDGNAPNAKTTISKEEKTATDARKLEPLRIYQVNQPIFKRSRMKRSNRLQQYYLIYLCRYQILAAAISLNVMCNSSLKNHRNSRTLR